jgi:hypothetical protein
MMNYTLPALIIFGILLGIAIVGLIKSNADAARLNGSGPSNVDAVRRREESQRMSGNQQ